MKNKTLTGILVSTLLNTNSLATECDFKTDCNVKAFVELVKFHGVKNEDNRYNLTVQVSGDRFYVEYFDNSPIGKVGEEDELRISDNGVSFYDSNLDGFLPRDRNYVSNDKVFGLGDINKHPEKRIEAETTYRKNILRISNHLLKK